MVGKGAARRRPGGDARSELVVVSCWTAVAVWLVWAGWCAGVYFSSPTVSYAVYSRPCFEPQPFAQLLVPPSPSPSFPSFPLGLRSWGADPMPPCAHAFPPLSHLLSKSFFPFLPPFPMR